MVLEIADKLKCIGNAYKKFISGNLNPLEDEIKVVYVFVIFKDIFR